MEGTSLDHKRLSQKSWGLTNLGSKLVIKRFFSDNYRMKCFRGDQNILYVILPYFNYCGFNRRRELFIEFVNQISSERNIRIVVSEIVGPTPLGKLRGVWKHIKVQSDSRLWIKENLINLAVTHLPRDWKYMSWIDADITFINQYWVEDTIQALTEYDVVQMWRSAVNLGPFGEVLKVDKSYGYMYKGSGTKWLPNDKYGFWHPGYAWACNRLAYDRMGGLIDWAILGSADRHMAMALTKNVLSSCPGNINQNYKTMLEEYQARVARLKLGWVAGTIIHSWHGSMENRKYKERWDILTKNNFDPFVDIGMTDKEVIELSKEGARLQPFLDEYFLGRKEDS
jgi:hypothetical protein